MLMSEVTPDIIPWIWQIVARNLGLSQQRCQRTMAARTAGTWRLILCRFGLLILAGRSTEVWFYVQKSSGTQWYEYRGDKVSVCSGNLCWHGMSRLCLLIWLAPPLVLSGSYKGMRVSAVWAWSRESPTAGPSGAWRHWPVSHTWM